MLRGENFDVDPFLRIVCQLVYVVW